MLYGSLSSAHLSYSYIINTTKVNVSVYATKSTFCSTICSMLVQLVKSEGFSLTVSHNWVCLSTFDSSLLPVSDWSDFKVSTLEPPFSASIVGRFTQVKLTCLRSKLRPSIRSGHVVLWCSAGCMWYRVVWGGRGFRVRVIASSAHHYELK